MGEIVLFKQNTATSNNQLGQEVQYAVICSNCLCNKCKYSCELPPEWSDELTVDEILNELCYNCDDCKEWNSSPLARHNKKRSCVRFVESENYILHKAKQRRNKFRVIR